MNINILGVVFILVLILSFSQNVLAADSAFEAESQRITERTGVDMMEVSPNASKELSPSNLSDEELAKIPYESQNNSEPWAKLFFVLVLVSLIAWLIKTNSKPRERFIKFLNKITKRQRIIATSIFAWFVYVLIRSSGHYEFLGLDFHGWDNDSLAANLFLPPLLIGLVWFIYKRTNDAKKNY